MAVELYHFWSSVCSVRCRMALEEKGVVWTSRYVDLFKFDQMRPEYLAINPKGVVPTLLHDGQPIRESSVINEYIDAAFTGPSLIPADPFGAARMREFTYQCDEGFSAIVKLTMVKYLLPKLRNRWSDEELINQAKRRPTKFYQDVHDRAVREEITEQELVAARATIEELLNYLTISNARLFQVPGLSAINSPSLIFRLRHTCFGLLLWAQTNFGLRIAGHGSMGGIKTSPHARPSIPPSRGRRVGRWL
jgi:glutathione S-transferase